MGEPCKKHDNVAFGPKKFYKQCDTIIQQPIAPLYFDQSESKNLKLFRDN